MKSIEQLEWDLRQFGNEIKEARKIAPDIIGSEAVALIQRNFAVGGTITDGGVQKWIPSRAAIKEKRKTLIKSGKMLSAINYEKRGNSVLVGVNLESVKYAQYHNEGMRPNIKRQFLYIPQRVFRKAEMEIVKQIKTFRQ